MQHQEQQQQNVNYIGIEGQAIVAPPRRQPKPIAPKPFVRVIEQPASKALRFRYECEGRTAGSIPGANSTPEHKTYPSIEIVGFKGRALVVVSCVTREAPYRPHPHQLVGKEGCKRGVCTLEINSETMRTVFSSLGIQCVKKKEVESALRQREEIRVDPFKTGFAHRKQPASIDLNSVRLCYQVFMESGQKGRFILPLTPVVSDPIYDKKAMSDLVISRMCGCSASVLGDSQIILLCEKVSKEDISVRFFETKNGQVIWEDYGDFEHVHVHMQTSITLKPPPYHTVDITEPVNVWVQLRRPSDGQTSQPVNFVYVPKVLDEEELRRKKQKIESDPRRLLLIKKHSQQQQQQRYQPQQQPYQPQQQQQQQLYQPQHQQQQQVYQPQQQQQQQHVNVVEWQMPLQHSRNNPFIQQQQAPALLPYQQLQQQHHQQPLMPQPQAYSTNPFLNLNNEHLNDLNRPQKLPTFLTPHGFGSGEGMTAAGLGAGSTAHMQWYHQSMQQQQQHSVAMQQQPAVAVQQQHTVAMQQQPAVAVHQQQYLVQVDNNAPYLMSSATVMNHNNYNIIGPATTVTSSTHNNGPMHGNLISFDDMELVRSHTEDQQLLRRLNTDGL